MNMIQSQSKHYKSRYADERQKEVHNKLPSNHFLHDERRMDNFLLWNTFFRRNLHRVATDYIGIPLHLYQIVILYLMGISRFIVIIASRSAAKSFIIASETGKQDCTFLSDESSIQIDYYRKNT